MKKENIAVSGDKIIQANAVVIFFKLDKTGPIFAECKSLGLVTSGKTLEEAKKMFEEAFSLWLEQVNAMGNIHEVLKALGWNMTSAPQPISRDISKVPIHLLDIQTKHILIPTGA